MFSPRVILFLMSSQWLSIEISLAAFIPLLIAQFTYWYFLDASGLLFVSLFQVPPLSQRSTMSFVTYGCFVFLRHPITSWVVDISTSLMFSERVSTSRSTRFNVAHFPLTVVLTTFGSWGFSKYKAILGSASSASLLALASCSLEQSHSRYLCQCLGNSCPCLVDAGVWASRQRI